MFKKWAIPGLIFLYFRLFNTVDRNKCSINFADDWIRTADLCFQKLPLYQLSHNHCPLYVTSVSLSKLPSRFIAINVQINVYLDQALGVGHCLMTSLR